MANTLSRPVTVFFICLLMCSYCFAQSISLYKDSSDAYYEKGDWKTALAFAEKGERMLAQDSGRTSISYAIFADQYMGLICQKNNLYPEALKWHLLSVETFRQLEDLYSNEYGQAITDLGDLDNTIGAYKEAETLLTEARNVFLKRSGDSGLNYLAAVNNLALTYNYTGKYSDAIELWQNVINRLDSNKADQKEDYVKTSENLANAYYKIGMLNTALKYIWKPLYFFEKKGELSEKEYLKCLSNITAIYRGLNNQKLSRKYLSVSLAVAKHSGDKLLYPATLNSAGAAAALDRNFKMAERLYREALDSSYDNNVLLTGTYFSIANNLASTFYHERQYYKADSVYHILFKQAGTLVSPEYGTLNLLYQGYCSLLIASGKYREAEDSLQSLNRRTFAYIHLNFAGMPESEKLSFIRTLYQNFDLCYSLLMLDKTASPGFRLFAFQNELALKGLVLYNQRSMISKVSHSSNQSLKEHFQNWLNCKQMLAKQYSLIPVKRTLNVDSIEREANMFEKLFGDTTQELQLLNSGVSQLKKMRDFLQANEAIIDFVHFRNLVDPSVVKNAFYGAFVLRKSDSLPKFVVLGNEKILLNFFEDIHGNRLNPGNLANHLYPIINSTQITVTSRHQQLYDFLWKPVYSLLHGIKKIYYSPAGLLSLISFNAVSNHHNGMLMDDYYFETYFSLRDLSRPGLNLKSEKIALWADINYDKGLPTGKKYFWSPIGNSELHYLDSLFGRHNLEYYTYRGEFATEDLFKQRSNGFTGVIHLSTHGFYYPEKKPASHPGENIFYNNPDPMLSCGLLFSGANKAWAGQSSSFQKQDGILTGYEISEMDLQHTSLVTLSACETGLGKLEDYEGVFGLRRAFKMAGVNKIIISLWAVPGRETAMLMKYFYHYWLSSYSPEESLLLAQRQMKRINETSRPFYWAGFVLTK